MLGIASLRAAATATAVWTYLSVSPAAAQELAVAEDAAAPDFSSMSDEELMAGADYGGRLPVDLLHPCPASCQDSPPSNWTIYTSLDRLALCDEPLLFDFAIDNPVADPNTPTKLRVCTAAGGNAETNINAVFNGTRVTGAPASKRADTAAPGCIVATAIETTTTVELSMYGETASQEDTDALIMGLQNLQRHFAGDSGCESAGLMFSYTQGVIAGLYTGSSFGGATVSSVIGGLAEQIQAGGSSTVVAQLCGNGRNADHVFGVAVSTSRNISSLQGAVKSWSDAKCVADLDSTTELKDVTIYESLVDLGPNGTLINNGTLSNPAARSNLHARADCKYISVVSGDGCASLASKCGISAADFTKYNPDKSLCSSLAPGQPVCCSSGTLPDLKPKPNSDGTCATYRVMSGDTCSALAAKNGLKVADIDTFNNGTTWGWYGCNKLLADVNICLSEGDPPMPYPISNAVCGPTKPGTVRDPNKPLAELSPCPLNACCNKWGQCGITDEFCTYKPGPSPGTSDLQNGCVWSCGTTIINKAVAPPSFQRVGYYETWNFNRDCLWQRIANANTDGSYTHIHWAFAEINTADYTVRIVDTYKQWDDFKTMSEKKIISFGGWGYSTEPATYDLLRQAMSPANRDKFATNVAKFVADNGLDGVDFDWEYPGAIDIPGTPPGQESDGPNYLKFLTTMKSKLASGKSLSIAAPASYWYLKAFPIKNMAAVLDYIVYMTYDLHGQWDAGNQWAVEGCPAGNCLRSHVNLTETGLALAMITKAGVGTSKIFVGESSYGRSFKMSQAGCRTPMCTFTGDRLNSNAAKGSCTDTAGYISNAEIDAIKSVQNVKVQSWHDGASNSDMMVYNDTEWVAYMTPATKQTRRDLWKGYNFAGTIDWAVDLQAFSDDDYDDPLDDTDDDEDYPEEFPEPLAPCDANYDTIEAIEAAGNNIPFHCQSRYIIKVLKKMHQEALTAYDSLIEGGYDNKFNTYADAVVHSGKSVVEKFMHDKGNNYFTCDVTEEVSCCSWCYHTFSPENGECRYCDDQMSCGGWSPICDEPEVLCDGVETVYKNITGPCSPDFSQRAGPEPADGYGNAVYWHLRRDKEDLFWADLYADTGIEKDSINWENVHRISECAPTDDHCGDRQWDYGFPVPSGFDREDVIDPKDVVQSAYDRFKGISGDMDEVTQSLDNEVYDGDEGDLVDAIALPVLLVKDAVKQMSDIVDEVNRWEEEKRKNIILAFLTAIFFFIPIAGEVLGSIAALANIGRVIATLGAAGELALDIYSIVDDKDNLPLAILSIVLSPLAILDAVQIGKAAGFRRDMTPEQVGKLGSRISDPLNSISKIKGAMCKRPDARRDLPIGVVPLPMSGLNGEAVDIWSL